MSISTDIPGDHYKWTEEDYSPRELERLAALNVKERVLGDLSSEEQYERELLVLKLDLSRILRHMSVCLARHDLRRAANAVELVAHRFQVAGPTREEAAQVTGPTQEEATQLSDALLAFFDGLDRVSQRYLLVQPGIALTREHLTALDLARRYRTPEKILVLLEAAHHGATGDPCLRCGSIIPLGEPQRCPGVCGRQSPDPITLDEQRYYVCCTRIDCDGVHHEAVLKKGGLQLTWETWPERVPWYISRGKRGPSCDSTEAYECRGCGEREYTRSDPSKGCPSCGLTSALVEEVSHGG